jgi:UDP-N-acetylmuramoyl-tripeptide--D-alanyl-D-alanine ligase
MIPISAAQISDILSSLTISGNPDTVAESVTIDSRTARDGDCFFAIIGERLDGHEFVDQALAAGASIVVVERPVETKGSAGADPAIIQVEDTTEALQVLGGWLRQQLNPTVVGITGSLGKTTTKDLTAALLGIRYDVHATPSNLNNHWGLPLSLLGLEAHHQVMVAEMAMSRATEIGALARLADPSIGVITNVAPAHMENFADLDAVAAAKGELARELPASGTLIVNADDPRTDAMPKKLAPHVTDVVRFGCRASADVRATDLAQDSGGWTLNLHIGSAARNIDLRLAGTPGVSCFLAAAATAHALEISIDEIATGAAKLEPLPDRGAIRRTDGISQRVAAKACTRFQILQ